MAIPGRLKIRTVNGWEYAGYGPEGVSGPSGAAGISGYSGRSGYSGWSGINGSGGGQAPLKFIVKNDSGTYKCYNESGTVVSSGSVAKDVINYALNNLTSGRTWKEKVLIRGNISLTAPINMVDYSTIELEGKITLANGINTYMVYASEKSYVEISGGIWDGNQSNQTVPDDCHGFAVIGCSELTIRDLEARYTGATPVFIVNSHEVLVHNVHAHHSGIYASGSNWWYPGVMLAWCYNSIVSDCRVHDSSRGGIYCYTESDSVVQVNKHIIVKNNIVERTYTSGIEVDTRETADTVNYAVVEGNICIDCGMDAEHPGIYVGWASGASQTFASTITITGNSIAQTGTNQYGQGIEVLGYGCTITGNSINNTYNTGIAVFGEHNTIIGNTIRNVRNAAASALALADATQCNVIGNIIADCAGIGILLFVSQLTGGCDSNNIIGNHIDNTANNPININDAASSDNLIANNHITNPQAYFSFASTGNTIKNNVGQYYLSEKSGTATFTASTSLVVTHGLYATPTKVQVTGTDANSGSLWVTNITSSQFTINRSSSTGTPVIYWYAEV